MRVSIFLHEFTAPALDGRIYWFGGFIGLADLLVWRIYWLGRFIMGALLG